MSNWRDQEKCWEQQERGEAGVSQGQFRAPVPTTPPLWAGIAHLPLRCPVLSPGPVSLCCWGQAGEADWGSLPVGDTPAPQQRGER